MPFLFIDEAESILGTRRASRYSSILSTLVPMFCSEMDGIDSLNDVVIILASNRADLIDPAILRPGRIDRKIKVNRPNKQGARDIYRIYLTNDLPYDGALTKESAAIGEAIDSTTLPAAGSLLPTNSGNTAAQIKVDKSSCPSRGNLYAAFVAPDSITENANTGPQRSVYVGVSTDAGLGTSFFNFTDHKVFTSPAGSLGATHGLANIFPALAVDSFGNVYTVWSDSQNIFLSSSTDLGTTWRAPVRVNT